MTSKHLSAIAWLLAGGLVAAFGPYIGWQPWQMQMFVVEVAILARAAL